jgi:hypothetical protein
MFHPETVDGLVVCLESVFGKQPGDCRCRVRSGVMDYFSPFIGVGLGRYPIFKPLYFVRAFWQFVA